MNDDDSEPGDLRDLENRLRKAHRQGGTENGTTQPSGLGIAFRLSTELVAAVVVGGAIGWALDRVFGTSPLLLIVMFFLGVAAGFLNVLRSARELNRNVARERNDGV